MERNEQCPILFDGAFGTYYLSLTGDTQPCELANLSAPQTVRAIHDAYIQAGAQAIKTNTFGVNTALSEDMELLHKVLLSGWQIAWEAARGRNVRVFADIGPDHCEDAAQAYLWKTEQFLALGARDFLFETMASLEELLPSLERIKQANRNAMAIVSFAVSQDGYTKRGLYYKTLIGAAVCNVHIDAVGLNCVCGPSHMLHLMRALDGTQKPLAAMPNAGYPSSLNGRMIFDDNAEYFARKLADLRQCGIDILGGCCGSTPRHISLARQAINATEMTLSGSVQPAAQDTSKKMPARTGGLADTQRKMIAVELDPPLDNDCTFILSASAELKACGVDMITVADSPLSRTRADSIMTAAKIRREIHMAVLPHITCRDKNHIALKAGLLGASFEGIDRVLVITGDPLIGAGKSGAVFKFNSFDLMSFISGLNEEVLSDAPLMIGGALNVNALNFRFELERAKQKVAHGASMLFTQPIFSEQAVENFLLARKALDCTLFAGILPVAGYKNAIFLINEVSGIEIPDAVVAGLKDKSPEEAAEISTAYSMSIINKVYDAADGFYIMTPLKKVHIVRGLIKEIRRKEK